VTLPIIYLLQRADGSASDLVRRIVNDRTVTPESWREVKQLLVEHRATDAAYRRAVEFAAAAKACLSVFPPTPERDALHALPDYVLARDR
jgi:octaprenyl-diphosphate synthase